MITKPKFKNFSEVLESQAKNNPDKLYVKDISAGKEFTYFQLNSKVNSAVRLLQKHNIKKGDIINLCLKNSTEFVILFFATIRVGAIISPLPSTMNEKELRKSLKFAQPKIVIIEKKFKNISEDYDTIEVDYINFTDELEKFSNKPTNIKLEEDDLVCMYYSSGTTSDPKGILYSRKYHTTLIEGVVNHYKFTKDVTHLGFLPMAHTAIINYSLLPAAYVGGTLIFSENFINIRTKFWDIVEKYNIGFVKTVPTVVFTILNTKYPNYSKDKIKLAFVGCGSGPLPLSTQNKFEEKYGIPVSNMYGTSETGQINYDNPNEINWKPGSIGFPMDMNKVKIVNDSFNEVSVGEIGEIIVRGHNPFAGYYKNESATKSNFKNGFFLTGDLAYLDNNGRFFYADRKKDIIIKGGANIFPGEIDEVLFKHPSIKESCTIGIPSPLFGEEIASFIVQNEPIEAQEIIEHCRRNLQQYKIPKQIIFVASIPQTASGKLLRRQLRELYEEKYTKSD